MDKQIQIYSVDTSMFYNERETKIHNILNRKYLKRKEIKKEINELSSNKDTAESYLRKKYALIGRHIKKLKTILVDEIGSNDSIRYLDHNLIKERNVISIFDSALTRTLQLKPDNLTTDIMVVQTYFFQVLKSIVEHGFIYEGEKYVLFTASAGQIRTKKNVFIKESIWLKYHDTLMCGLSIIDINEGKEQGVNINKFLAYLALCNSATEDWSRFDINKSIVVDDLETNVRSLVDYIDSKDYKISRVEMDIPINHTDGCGMMLPKISKKSFMVRLPWVKGLLVPFPFDKFAKENESYIVKDIYGQEHDIIKEKIEVIFTKSQFKMWKYYNSWEDYKSKYNQHNCTAAKCNEEDDDFSDAKLNYQMLQTLNHMTDEELHAIGKKSFDAILRIGSNKSAMLKALGVTKSNTNKTYFQQALEIYPELLYDSFSRETLRDIKKSLVKEAKSGKLSIKGKYTFIIPDLYAFCERIFLKEESPSGLLSNGEVYCSLFLDGDKLDCLRSPHLYREHAVRKNMIKNDYKTWFITKGLYASVHDPISKILQYDCDGDKSLVTSDKTIVECAERHMEGVVPLYYEMAVSGKQKITKENLYDGLVAAYTGGNIGEISNNISKLWNKEEIDLDVIKWLCMENNFVIDYAKTLYKLERPKDISIKIKKHLKTKLPNYFLYAKDKLESQVEDSNNSTVNRLGKLTPKRKVVFSKDLGLKKFDYKLLLSDSKSHIESQKIINTYEEFNKKRRFIKITKDNLHIYKNFRNDLLTIHNDVDQIVNTLVYYLFVKKKSSKKEILWQSFGDVLIRNLKENLRNNPDYKQCKACCVRVKEKQGKMYCESCAKKITNANVAMAMKRLRDKNKNAL